jgi:murein L,D-transpeptidase YafK
MLAGCNADNVVPAGRAQAPLSEKTVALIQSKDMDQNSPILVRVFKEEAELEVWKKNRAGDYALLKTYPICRWSGDLGPKKKQGDRQAPEGFYTITPGQMNPNSNYYLAFNTGYPNAYDRAHNYTGSELMVHGDCSSRGCYAMTDKQILEIYALARDAFFGGQKEFQFEAFPFRMTALNMAKHRNNPNFAFWKMLKEGYDHFEATRQEPKVAVCEKRYVFDAVSRDGSHPLQSNPRGQCPAYQIDPQIASTVLDYRRTQQVKMANYIARNVTTAPPHVGDGGTNPIFAGNFTRTPELDNSGRTYPSYPVASAVPGALPRVPNPPGTTIPKVGAALKKEAAKPPPQPTASEPQQPVVQVAMARVPMPTPAPRAKQGEAPQQKSFTIASLFGNLFQQEQSSAAEPAVAKEGTATPPEPPVELRGSNTEMAAKPKPAAPSQATKVHIASPVKLHPKPQQSAPEKPVAVAVAKSEPTPVAPAPKPRPPPAKQVANAAAPVQRVARTAQPPAEARPIIRTAFTAPPASTNGLLAGAQPVMPTGSFSR